MSRHFAEVAFTPHVKAEQEKHGSRAQYQRMMQYGPDAETLGASEREFIETRDGIYVATVSETGWPYVQFRGGPKGFLQVIDDRTLGFADFRGNRQYITVGNWRTNDRVALFLMDYPTQTRLKILGRVEVKESSDDPALAKRLTMPGYRAVVERTVLIHLEGFDWNCQQHITPRWSQEELAPLLEPLQKRLATLEAENRELRQKLANAG